MTRPDPADRPALEPVRRINAPTRAEGRQKDGVLPSRYVLDVVASSAADVVSSVGGWLFDRRSAGWCVNVLVPDLQDVKPLQILGVGILDPAAGLTTILESKPTAGLAVAADRLHGEGRLQRVVLRAARSGITEVSVWGDEESADLIDHGDLVMYRPSSAAAAFKGYAMAAAGLAVPDVAPFETLYRFGLRPRDSI